MNYSVQLERCSNVIFSFDDEECTPIDMYNEEPNSIDGRISLNNEYIGFFRVYELYNDCGFFDRCDAVSEDCKIIASTICGKSGKVLKKYLPDAAEYDAILILDQIEINEKYRGMGIGSNVVKNLLYMIKYQLDSGCAIFLCASDYEAAKKYGFDSDEYRDGCKRLIKFYKKQGFKTIKDNIMVYRKE